MSRRAALPLERYRARRSWPAWAILLALFGALAGLYLLALFARIAFAPL